MNRFKLTNDTRGFSLVEVIAAVVIIGIVLISLSQIFIQTNKSAVNNSEKIIMLNLANAELERLKITGITFIDGGATTQIKEVVLNGKTYKTTIQKYDCDSTNDCKNYKLHNISVEISIENSNTKAAVEGFVPYAQTS